jgi:hypothetical protein
MNCEIEVGFNLLELTLLPLHPVPSCFWLLFNLLIATITLCCLKFFLWIVCLTNLPISNTLLLKYKLEKYYHNYHNCS